MTRVEIKVLELIEERNPLSELLTVSKVLCLHWIAEAFHLFLTGCHVCFVIERSCYALQFEYHAYQDIPLSANNDNIFFGRLLRCLF